ncbi:hypothetical protein [Asticcacaulis sp. EMRT-3]|uniref:hypothetical protein n=1 Tax=Asticcacaulis sp. EMRT-3 TaxID=3040349 RepID=UPI0024AF5A1B|nr:hypothetical protein [Asticcacaulis sp. EMRT-3]MDI7774615.1 hypothetical protein [Asticcacaulis sp. EMRT-3]
MRLWRGGGGYALSAILIICGLGRAAGAWAAAWPEDPGHSEIIASFEPGSASRGYDATGHADAPLDNWRQTEASLYIDHGVTSRFSLATKLNFKVYNTDNIKFSGLSSLEIDGRYALHVGNDYVLAVGAGLEGLGKGRRSDYDNLFGRQGTDLDLRIYLGRNFRIARTPAFIDLQAARHIRQFNPDEWRLEGTLGLKPSPRWMVMAQVFSGRADRQNGYQAQWLNTELSVVRSLGASQKTSLQLGLRQTTAGRNVPRVNAFIVSLWRRY